MRIMSTILVYKVELIPKMEDANTICPECGNHLIFYRQDSSKGCYCRNAKCEYGFVTSYFPEIVLDKTIYSLYITSLGNNPKQAIVFISLQFNLNINTARKFKGSGKLLFSGSAAEIFKVREKTKSKRHLSRDRS